MHNVRLLLGRAPGRTTFLSTPEVCVGSLHGCTDGCTSAEVAVPWSQPVRVEEGAVAVTSRCQHSDTAAARATYSCCRPTGSVSPAAAGSTLLTRPFNSTACSSLHYAATALAPSAARLGYHGFCLSHHHRSGTRRLGAVPAGSDCHRALSTSAAAPSSSTTSTSSSPSSTYLYSRPGPEPAAVLLEPLLQGRPFEVAQIPGRGRGLVSCRPIAAGEVVLTEAPMLAYPADQHQHQVCYHCLAAMPPGADVLRHRPTGRRFCSDACLSVSLREYLAVETAAAAARARVPTAAADVGAAGAASAAASGGAASSAPAAGTAAAAGASGSASGASPSSAQAGAGGGAAGSAQAAAPAPTAAAAASGGFSPLDVLYEQCRTAGERFPLIAARLAFMEMTAALAAAAQRCAARASSGSGSSNASSSTSSQTSPASTSPSSASVSASAPSSSSSSSSSSSPSPPPPPRGDALRSMHVLCYANVPQPYPEAWVQQHALLAAALGAVARASPATLRNLAAAAAGAASAEAAGLAAPDAAARLAAAAAAAAERLTLDWFVGVMSRLHLNSFQVHNPLAGSDPTDLAAAASALVSDSGGGRAAAGSGTYLLASLLNHSCEPCLELAFPGMDGTAAFVAARDIAPGEELCVSYMDVALPYESRQRHLEWSYGFVCRCPRCREEGAAEAVDAAEEEARRHGGSGSGGSAGGGGGATS
ncbi:hypothetical protein CHLRE_02g116850v5 [Chlamydomonas reinhardtii]|uniref:SET domain-containing protein n=1 Tax=Chlamydomonas reinhardtii TaxID=3055 RepID=A0A2K3E3C5_CHLRE|nr:uncharacterized protein CHLRE_02g116850v5 [Chlamydomonas reinhardtii]PNW87292.1 hypothetical protein CHLRE_02g116850v5 [Chlamydomonas reinhardtii]